MTDKNKKEVEQILSYQDGDIVDGRRYGVDRPDQFHFYRPAFEIPAFSNVINIGNASPWSKEDIKDLVRLNYFGGDDAPYNTHLAERSCAQIAERMRWESLLDYVVQQAAERER